jgi:GntR family transcriptional repressor for pyruvate dehydrogenase complex
MEAAHARRSGVEEAALDAEFHMAIVEASHNVVMLHVMRATYGLLREGVQANRQAMFRQRTTRAALLDQHRAIRDALLARDATGARTAVERHLDFVEQALHDQRRTEHNETVARQRLAQEAGR